MFGIGPMELVLIMIVALLVLGPKRMPELARTLGRGLSEFRRASNELRQSLALDDLQNDLRAGMSGTGSIQKPRQDADRPAQAGDDLPPGPGGPDTAQKDAGNDARGASGNAPTSAETEREAGASDAGHPGELPLDADPHAHHDDPDQEDAKAQSGQRPASADAAPDASEASEQPTRSSPRSGPKPADAPLGNVPVGNVPVGSVPVGDAPTGDAPGSSDDRRG